MDTIKKREEEATSKETLKDIEESESTPETSETTDADGPSPDGALDEPDELREGDPI